MALDPVTGLQTGSPSRTGGALLDGLYVPPKSKPVAPPPPVVPTTPYAPGDPVAAPTTPHPTGPTIHDLQALIENDPLYHQTAADVAASRISSQAQLSAARQRALVQYGATPASDLAANKGLVGDVAPDINGTVQQLAQQNTAAGLSTVGRLRQAYDENIRALQDSLAARGLLSSGETGYQLGKQNTQYQRSGYDALQQLLDLLAGYQGSYLTNDQSLRAQLAAAAQAAAGRIPLDTSTPVPPPTAPPPGGNGTPPPPPPTSLDQYFRALPGGGFAAPTTQAPGSRLPGLLYAS